jgi:hypothetical protein
VLGDFSAKAGREVIFKPTIGNEGLHQLIHYKGAEVINFATSKHLIFKNKLFSRRGNHKFLNV